MAATLKPYDPREQAVEPEPILRLAPTPQLASWTRDDVARELEVEKARVLRAIWIEMHRAALLYGRQEALQSAKDAIYLEFGAEALSS